MAVRMSAIVLTDFCTWVPLIFLCILVQVDIIVVNPVVYAWTVAFIIPIKSAINPFIYTLITFLYERRRRIKRRHISTTNLLIDYT